MSNILVDRQEERPDFNTERQKRRRVMTDEEVAQETTVRGEKRKRLDFIYEQERQGLETNIIANVNVLLHQMKRRKKLIGKRPVAIVSTVQSASTSDSSDASPSTIADTHCACCVTKKEKQAKKYDEETVHAMIGVALETQKEKLFESFIEQHLDFIAQRDEYDQSLLPQTDDFGYIS